MIFDDAYALANAVLFEGYALYPYRASAPKNQLRWQFGVLAPRGWSEAGGGEAWWQETQCLLEPAGAEGTLTLHGRLRFLQVQRRHDAGAAVASWDEGEIQEVDFALVFEAAADAADPLAVASVPVSIPGGTVSDGPVRRQRWPLSGRIHLAAHAVAEAPRLVRARVRVENLAAAPAPGAPRDEALCWSLIGSHVLLAVTGGAFVSLLDPPAHAAAPAAACQSVRTYPVLAGPPGRRDLLLSAPIILYDHPAVAPESPRDLFDAAEIDEILALRILTLTDAEKREARATDARVAALVDQIERLGPDGLARLHGRLDRREATLLLDGFVIGAGSRVRLHPGARRSDAQDMFLDGLTATVRQVLRDVDDRDCLAVTLDADPAADLMNAHGRYRYFYPDEVEPMAADMAPAPPPR